MMNSIRRSAGIVTTLIWMMVCVGALAAGDLPGLKGPYDEQVGKVRADCDARLKELSQQYTQGLQTLEAQFKHAGDLDSVLAVRKELQRFNEAATMTAGDIVETPAVSTLQRGYISGKNAANKERDKQIGKLAGAYVAQLEQLKRALTQQDNIIAALDVQKELEQVRESGDLPAPVAPPPQPRPVPVVPKAPVANNTESAPLAPGALHTPKGTFWILATDNGVPAKDVSFLFQIEPDGKVSRENTDFNGKISFHVENNNTYRLVMITEKYADAELSNLREGEAYPIKLQPRGQNEGLVEIRQRQCQLPDIRRLVANGSWSSSNGERGMDLQAMNSRVKVQSNYMTHGMNMNGGGVTYSSAYFMVSDGRTATFQIGEIKYEVKAIMVGDHAFLSYKKQ